MRRIRVDFWKTTRSFRPTHDFQQQHHIICKLLIASHSVFSLKYGGLGWPSPFWFRFLFSVSSFAFPFSVSSFFGLFYQKERRKMKQKMKDLNQKGDGHPSPPYLRILAMHELKTAKMGNFQLCHQRVFLIVT